MRARNAELPQVTRMRKLLAGRGVGLGATAGPIAALAPGEASPDEFGRDAPDGLAGAFQPEAWLKRP